MIDINKSEFNFLINEDIKSKRVLIVTDNGNLEKDLEEALNIAESAQLDLVQFSMNNGIAVCRLVDYSKYIYDLKKKKKQAHKSQHKIETKEIRLGATISDNDLKIKASYIDKILNDGDRVTISIIYKGRMRLRMDAGFEMIKKLMGYVTVEYIIEKEPIASGNRIITTLIKK